jgi:DNA-binding CsgD family transcriptional regulator/PAS domain-containing protein
MNMTEELISRRGLLDLVGNIYEASCDAGCWADVMRQVTAITGSKSAMLAYRDLEQPQASFQFAYNISPEILEIYNHRFASSDPFFELSARTVPLGKTSADHKMVPDRQELERVCGEFFTGMMKPFDLWHIGGAFLFRDNSRAAAIALQRGQSQGPWIDAELDLVDMLVPHFQRAFRIHKEFNRLRLQEQAYLNALDRLVIGLVLLDDTGRVVYKNPMADRILREHPAIRETGGMIRATGHAQAILLQKLIQQASNNAYGAGEPPGGAIGLKHDNCPWPLPVLVTSVRRSGFPGAGAVPGAHAALLMADAEQSHPIAPDTLSEAYGLTPAEALVAIAIANGMSVEDISRAHKTSSHTVRSQLRSIYEKLNVSRQAELVIVLLSGPFGLVT